MPAATAPTRHATLTAYRIVLGGLFACHGAATLFGIFGGAHQRGAAASFAAWPGWWAGLIQLVGGILVAIGLAARAAAVVCSGSMAYAYFAVHQPDGLLPIGNGGEKAALFCWAFLLIAVLGPGRWTVRGLFRRNRPEADLGAGSS